MSILSLSLCLQNYNRYFDISEWTDDIDEVQNKAKSLKDTLTSLQDGSISDSDLVELFKSYPDLAKFSGKHGKS